MTSKDNATQGWRKLGGPFGAVYLVVPAVPNGEYHLGPMLEEHVDLILAALQRPSREAAALTQIEVQQKRIIFQQQEVDRLVGAEATLIEALRARCIYCVAGIPFRSKQTLKTGHVIENKHQVEKGMPWLACKLTDAERALISPPGLNTG